MTAISAGTVKALRERTGLGMMECKKALADAGGDLVKAEELLRIRSGARAGKAAARVAAEGVIGAWVSADGRTGALVELNCETDFVAKNDAFLAFAHDLAVAVAEADPADTDALGRISSGDSTLEARRQALVQKIGENIAIRRYARLRADARIAQYVHGNRIGVLVDYEGDPDTGKDLALHVAFARPAYRARSEVPAEVIAKEREILTARARESGKPAEIVSRMVEGGVNKFIAEMTLLGQPFVKDDKVTVERMLAARKAQVRDYRFLVVGEGIERKTTDFAAEVRAAAGATG